MGKALILNDCDFSSRNIGKIGTEKESIIINVTSSTSLVTAIADNIVTSDITITVGVLGQITILSGATQGTLQIPESTTERVEQLLCSPTEDATYIYNLSSATVVIPAKVISANIAVVGDNDITGDVRAGRLSIIDLDNMKQVVGTQSQVTDDNKEYLGPISWSTQLGSEYISISQTENGTYCDISVNPQAVVESVGIIANIVGTEVTSEKIIAVTYQPADYLINSFSDLQEIETLIENNAESNISLTRVSGSTYVPADGNGFAGARFRITNDIDCNQSHVELGTVYTGKTTFFGGILDGAGYRLYNIGGDCGRTGTAAQGGRVGSALIGHGKACTVQNLIMEGSVRNIASRGFGLVCAMVSDQCQFHGLYLDVDITTESSVTAGTTVLAGWSSLNGSVIIDDCVYAGSCTSQYTISGFGNLRNCVQRCSVIGTLKVQQTTRASANLTMFGSFDYDKSRTYSCISYADVVFNRNNIASGTIYVGQSPTGTFDLSTINAQDVPTRYAANTIGADNITINAMAMGSTQMTESEVKALSASTSGSILHTIGYYPLINNRYATKSEILNKIR